MLVRLRDFAEVNRLSQRTVQIHIKENYDVLGEHVERRGKQGTWLDEFAVNFLLERIQLPTKDEVLVPTAREAALMEQLAQAQKQRAEAEQAARINAEAAGKVLFLEAAQAEQSKQIDTLTRENAVLSADNARKDKSLQEEREARQKLSDELTASDNYAAALEEWMSLPWLKRRRTPKPVRQNQDINQK